MPKVGSNKFPYTAKGKEEAAKALKKKKKKKKPVKKMMRGGKVGRRKY